MRQEVVRKYREETVKVLGKSWEFTESTRGNGKSTNQISTGKVTKKKYKIPGMVTENRKLELVKYKESTYKLPGKYK